MSYGFMPPEIAIDEHTADMHRKLIEHRKEEAEEGGEEDDEC